MRLRQLQWDQHTFNIARTFKCQKNLFALYPTQFVNRSKKTPVAWSKERLQKYDHGASKHVYDIVTGDESWIYAYEPESKQQPNPTKIARTRSTFKQMIACFFGKTGHVAIVPLEQRRTVNSESYTTICLPVVFQEIRKTNRRRQ